MILNAKPSNITVVGLSNGRTIWGSTKQQPEGNFRQQPRPEFYVPHWNSAEER